MKYLFIIITFIAIHSCKNKIQAEFEITNTTEETIDSISIKASNQETNIHYLTLQSGETQTYWLNMTDLPKMDGNYEFSYKLNNTNHKEEKFGYFSNGSPMEKITKIEIRKDSVIIDFVYNKY